MKRTKLNAVLIGLALIVFGVILFAYPVTTIATVLRVIGIGLLLVGAIGIAAFFASKEETKSLRSLLVGIVEVVIGLVFLANPAFIASIYPVILGIVIVLECLDNALFVEFLDEVLSLLDGIRPLERRRLEIPPGILHERLYFLECIILKASLIFIFKNCWANHDDEIRLYCNLRLGTKQPAY